MGQSGRGELDDKTLSVNAFYEQAIERQEDGTLLIMNAIEPWMSKHDDIDEQILHNALSRITGKDTTIAFWPTGGSESFVSGKLPQRNALFGLIYPFIVGANIKQNGTSIGVTYRHEGIAAYGVARDPRNKRKRVEVKSLPRSVIERQSRGCEITVSGIPGFSENNLPLIVLRGATNPEENHKVVLESVVATECLKDIPYVIERTYSKVGNTMRLQALRFIHTEAYKTSDFSEYISLSNPARGMVFRGKEVQSTNGTILLAKHKSVHGEFLVPMDCDVVIANVNEQENNLALEVRFEQFECPSHTQNFSIPLSISLESALVRTFAEYDLWKNKGVEGLATSVSQMWSAVELVAP